MNFFQYLAAVFAAFMLMIQTAPLNSTGSPADSGQSNMQAEPGKTHDTLIEYVPGKEPSPEELVSDPLPDPTYEYPTEKFDDSGIRIAAAGTVPIEQEKREWNNEQMPLLGHLSVELMGLLDKFGENLAGVSFSSNDQYLEVYVASPQGAGVPEVINLAKSHGLANHVVIIPVQRSLGELTAAADEVSRVSGGLFFASPDFVSNGLRIKQTELIIEDPPKSAVRYTIKEAEELSQILSEVVRTIGDVPLIIERYSLEKPAHKLQ